MIQDAIVVMGVASCGKSTVGNALANKLNARFVEGDELHPPANVAKMSVGVPLEDDDRWPWLRLVGRALRGSDAIVASCSALKRSYRKLIAEEAQRRVLFIFLDGDRSILEKRTRERKKHFMPSSLIASQIAVLESPGADEQFIAIGAALPVNDIVVRALIWLASQQE
jgi:gluconokinase